MSRVFTKTAKGFRESNGKSQELSEDLHDLLRVCKGQFSVDDFTATGRESESIGRALDELLERGFLREIHELTPLDPPAHAVGAELAHVIETDANDRQPGTDHEDVRQRELIRDRIAQREDGRTGRRKKMLLSLAVAVIFVISALVISLQWASFDGKRQEFEQLASATLGTQVSIGRAQFSVFPTPQWQLDDVRVGTESAPATVGRMIVESSLLSLIRLPKEFSGLRMESVRLPASVAHQIVHGSGVSLPLLSPQVSVSDLVVQTEMTLLPALAMDVIVHGGQVASIEASGEDENFGKFVLNGQRMPEFWQWHVTAQRYVVPLGGDFPLTDVVLKGELAENKLTITDFSGRRFDGDIRASGVISWGESWRAQLRIDAQRLDVVQLAPSWGKEGVVSGNADVRAEAVEASDLFLHARSVGSFSMAAGVLAGIDLDKLIQGRGIGEQFRFQSLLGKFLLAGNRLELPEVVLSAGALTAQGSVVIASDRRVAGRFAVQVKTPGNHLSSSFLLGGRAEQPQFSH